MDSKRSASYGALGDDRSAADRRQHRASYQGDLGDEFQGSGHPHLDRTTPAAPSGRWSWLRAGLVVAASATAFSATVGVVHYTSYTGTEQSLASSISTLANAKGLSVEDATQAAPAIVAVTSDLNARGSDEQQKGIASVQRIVAYEDRQSPSLAVEVTEEMTQDTPSGDLSFTAMNEYNRRGDVIGKGYAWLDGHHLVEPYRATTLAIESPVDGRTYSWDIIDTRSVEKTLGQFEGSSVEVTFESSPEYTIVLLEKRADGTLSRSLATNVYCKYVRREIRSLFDDERNEMFDAMKVLWDVSFDEGQLKYGEGYLDVWTIDKFHQIGASGLECDQLHDGIGFGITHSMVTLMFEGSLQAVNPKLSLPYWDFTIEADTIDNHYDGDYTKLREASDLWTSEWFGSVDNEDFQVKDGRWGNLTMPMVDPEDADMLGADVYGRMRSPWNVNDREYLTRGCGEMCGIPSTTFYEWPTCEVHYSMNSMLNSYYAWTWHSQYGPHGPVHVWIGGNIDCKKDMQIVERIIGEEYMNLIIGFSFINRKGLFREGLFKCHGRADESLTAEEVMQQGYCGCLDLDLDKKEDWEPIYELFHYNWDFHELTDAEKQKLAFQYCNGVIGIGESSQSSSPLDPTFWSLHPTMERIYMFKQLTGTMTDHSWPDYPGTFVGDDGTVYDVIISIESDTCNGHRGSDVFPYGILEGLMEPHFTFFDETGPNTRSNRDLVHLFDPSVNALPYIYDNFEWPHCAAQGWDFNDLYADSAKPDDSVKSNDLDWGVFVRGERYQELYGKNSLKERMAILANK